jgi:NTE family protein
MTDDVPLQTHIGRNALAVLASVPLFEELDPGALIAVAEQVDWFCLPSGETLFEQGDQADSLYAVTSGTLGAFRYADNGHRKLLGRIKRGETVGESSLVSGSSRTATVVALRDTELLRFSSAAFENVIREYPAAMLHIARLTVARLERSLSNASARASSRTFAVVGVSTDIDERVFAEQLASELSRFGKTELFAGDSQAGRSSAWFNDVESKRDFLVFVADRKSLTWTRQCVAQADSVILLAEARAEPHHWPHIDLENPDSPILQNAELVLLQRRFVRPGSAKRWLKQFPVRQHHHCRSPEDVGRIGRLLTGNGIGLVLSGGGARGFAHIGVIRALRQAGIPIDHCAGTSVGAIIAAGVAAGWDDEQLVEKLRRTFVTRNPIGDYTLPLMSLASGRRVSRLLKNEVGAIDITDLQLPFFCLATNLTTGTAVVQQSGLLWRALRAAVAIPGILPPVIHDGQVYVDGAVLNNLPVDVMREQDRGHVIGVDVGGRQPLIAGEDVDDMSILTRLRLIREKRAPNIFQILLRSGSLSSALAASSNKDASSILLAPPVDDIDMLDWKAFDRALEAGYRHASGRIPEIQELIAGK